MVQLSHPYMTTRKNIALTRWTFVGKVMSLLLNMLSRLVTGLPWWLRGESICLQCERPGFDPWVGKIAWRRDRLPTTVFLDFLGGSDGKLSACNAGDQGSIPGLGRSSGEEMTNLDSILKKRNIILMTKLCIVKAIVFPVIMYGCENWTIEKAEHQKKN